MKVSINVDKTGYIQTFGGEGGDGYFNLDEYGIGIGEVHVDGISPEQMCKLVCLAVDHLVTNGHKFEFKFTGHQDRPYDFVCVDKK